MILGIFVGVLVLYLTNPEQSPDGAEPVVNPSQCKVTVLADVLRVRAAPDVNAPVVDRFQQNAVTDADKVVQNGFRKVGDNRWAASEFLAPVPGSDCGT